MNSHLLSPLTDHALLVCAGLLAAAALAWPARALLKRDPQSCYQLLLGLLMGAVAVLPLQLLVQGSAAPLAAPARDWLRSLVRPRRADDVPREPSAPPAEESPSRTFLVDRGSVAPAAVDAAPAPIAPPLATGESVLSSAGIERTAAAAGAAPGSFARAAAAAESAAAFAGRRLAALAQEIGWERAAAGAWLLGVALVASRRLLRALRTLRLVARARPVSDPATLALWRSVGAGSRIAARVRLVAASEVGSPACTGLFRRVLILPERPARPLAPAILEWALRHELVHLERGDQWAALFQSVVTAVLWFHPAAWWLSGEIARLRELSCDQRVVETSGRRRSYALALLECAATLSRSITANPITASDAEPHSAGVRCALLHWSRSPSQIRRRIEMLTVESQSLPRARKVLGIVVAGCALAIPAFAQVAGAAALLPARQQAPAPPPAPVAPAPPAPPALPATPSLVPLDDQDASTPPAAPKKKRRHVVPPAGSAPVAPLPDPAIALPAPPAPIAGEGAPVGLPPAPPDPNLQAGPVVAPANVAWPLANAGAPCVAAGSGDGDDRVDFSVANGVDDPCAIAACDDGAEEYSAAVRAQLRATQRQIEQALKQVQRAQASQQGGVKRQLEQLHRQEERMQSQQERTRASIADRIARTDDDGQRADLEKQLAKLEADADRTSAETAKRSDELEAALAQLDRADLSGCFDSLGDYQQSMDGQVAELKQTLRAVAQQALAAERQVLQAKKSGKQGYTSEESDDDDGAKAAKLRKLDAEKIAKKAQMAAQKARAELAQSLARAGDCGALNAETRRQIEEALARVEQVDQAKLKEAIERAVAAAQRAAAASAQGASGGVDLPAAPRAPKGARAPAKPRTPAPPAMGGEPATAEPALPRRSGLGLGNGAPAGRGGGGADEAKLLDKISALEAEIASLRAELERMRAQPQVPADPAPAKRVRAMR
jgi:beta-lactamase regulating signal transducer with metallopeptidase domain